MSLFFGNILYYYALMLVKFSLIYGVCIEHRLDATLNHQNATSAYELFGIHRGRHIPLRIFCNRCIKEWKENKIANFKYIAAMSLMIGAISVTPENVLKMVWKKILLWFWDLQYENALANNDKMLEQFRKLSKIGSG